MTRLTLAQLKWPLVAAACALAAFAVYYRTLAPTIVFGDSPELTAAAYVAGVPHPTGYPLYMMVGHLWLRAFPWSSPAFGLNLLSAVFGALAVGLLPLLARRFTRNAGLAAVSALLFAFSVTFWSQALIAEVYTLHLLLSAALLLLLLRWDRTGDRRTLYALAFMFGLSLAHHLSTVHFVPAFMYYAWTSRHRKQFLAELRWTVPLAAAPLLLYAYLPLAAARDTGLNWGDVRTVDQFIAHVTGRIYRWQMFHRTPADLWAAISDYAFPPGRHAQGYLMSQFSASILWLAPLGMVRLWKTDRRLLSLSGITYLVGVVYAINYDIPDIEVYYLVSHLMVALWIGSGLSLLVTLLRRAVRARRIRLYERRRIYALASVAALAFPGVLVVNNWATNNRAGFTTALGVGRTYIGAVKPGAIIISDMDRFHFPMLYARYVEGRRPDVVLVPTMDLFTPVHFSLLKGLEGQGVTVTVPPEYRRWTAGRRYYGMLERLVADNAARRPVYLLGFKPERVASAAFRKIVPGFRYVVDERTQLIEVLHPGGSRQEHAAEAEHEHSHAAQASRKRRPPGEALGS